MDLPIHLTSQLREHLKALRKSRGLTQAALGQRLGVGQARIAEIESNPGAVSIDQLIKLISALRASLVLRDDGPQAVAGVPGEPAAPPSLPAKKSRKPAGRPEAHTKAAPTPGPGLVIQAKKGSW